MSPIHTILLVASLLLWCHTALAQTASADDYFNLAAKQYVKEDKVSALRTLDKGLQQHPGDPRLLKLAEELLKEEKPQEQSSPQDQQNEEKQGEEQGKDDKSDQGKQDEKQDEKQDDGSKQEKREDPSGKPKPQPGKISPQDAERMLDAMNRQEKDVQDKVRNRQRSTTRTPIDKDW